MWWVSALMVMAAGPTIAQNTSHDFIVSVVPSDDTSLPSPRARNQEPDAAQIEAMVRRAVDLIGGMASVVPDTARLVLLKPNVGAYSESGSGIVTDARVVRAVAILVHEAAPGARILIAEAAGGWALPSMRATAPPWVSRRIFDDGFERAGHWETVDELRERGIDIDCLDMNFDRSYTMTVPGGGLAVDEYSIAASIIDADVWINIPVAKVHGAKITCSMKNHFGLLPGTIYGWSKSTGTPDHGPMPHSPNIIDEAFVDLWSLTRTDLNVVDMIKGSEGGAFEDTYKRTNAVLAGRHPVAVDLVVAKLMGFNPDDMEWADLAHQRDLGPRWIEEVQVRGAAVDGLVSRWVKAGGSYDWGEWREQADYGKGPRRWTLLGPLAQDHAFADGEIAALKPEPGSDDWSRVVWFGHDKIDLDKYFDDPVKRSVYAFTHFTMAKSDSVRYWIGADEGMRIWIDGDLVFDTATHANLKRRRRHELGQIRLPGYLAAGEHRLLVRVDQSRGPFSFSFNICEPIDDARFAGNRYPGVRYYVTPADNSIAVRVKPHIHERRFSGDDSILGDLELEPHPSHTVTLENGAITVSGVDVPRASDVYSTLIAAAGADRDSHTVELVRHSPFATTPIGPSRLLDLVMSRPFEQTIPIAAFARSLGIRYELTLGMGKAQSLKAISDWLEFGHTPAIGDGSTWWLVDGYRPGEEIELHLVGADTSFWRATTREWEAQVPGHGNVNCPVVVAFGESDAVTAQAFGNTLSRVALNLSLQSVVEQHLRRDRYSCPAGLNAWDFSVIRWERLPLTPTWGRQPINRSLLAQTRSRHLQPLARQRRRASRFYQQVAAKAKDAATASRMAAISAAYGEVVEHLETLSQMLPETAFGPLSKSDAARLEQLPRTSGLLRQARTAERRAASLLAEHLSQPPLPPTGEDLLYRRDLGKKLMVCRNLNEGIYDYELSDDAIDPNRVHGIRSRRRTCELLIPVPRQAGWQLAVETIEGSASGWVVEQPTEANDWFARVHIDNLSAWWDGRDSEVVVWAIPPEEQTAGAPGGKR